MRLSASGAAFIALSLLPLSHFFQCLWKREKEKYFVILQLLDCGISFPSSYHTLATLIIWSPNFLNGVRKRPTAIQHIWLSTLMSLITTML